MRLSKAPKEATAEDGEITIPVGDVKGITLVGPLRDGAAAAAALARVGTQATGTGSRWALAPKPYVCMECVKGFWHVAGLLAHQRPQHRVLGHGLGVAGGEKPAHICVKCGEGFMQGAALRKHKKIHAVGRLQSTAADSFYQAG